MADSTKKRTVLLTGGGGGGSIAVCRSLQSLGCYRVIMADADPWAAGLLFGDAKYTVPFGNKPEFPSVIKEIIEKEEVDVLVPLVDEEIIPSLQLKKKGLRAKVLLPTEDFCNTSLDKYKCMEALIHVEGGPISPMGYLAVTENIENKLSFPMFAKPRFGRGSRGIQVIRDRDDLNGFLRIRRSSLENWVIQEYLEGIEYTVSVAVDKNNELMGVIPKRVVNKRGVTITAYTENVPAIDRICEIITRKLNPSGPFNVQTFVDASGKPFVFEINPRYSTTVALTIAAGFNEVDILIRRLFDEEIQKPEIKWNLAMLRHWEQIYKYTDEMDLV